MPIQVTTTLPDVSAPTLDNGVEDEIGLSWTDVSNYGEYDIQYRETGVTTWTTEPSVGEATTSANIIGLEDGEEYEVRMRTQTEHVTGAWTTPTSIVTKFPGATGLTVGVVTATSIPLSWTDNSDNEDGFVVERREQFRSGWGEWRERADLAPNTTTFSDGTQPNTTYEYRIRAFTEHTEATSSSVQTTSSDDGVRTDRVPARGWHVVLEGTAGNRFSPSIVGEPTLNPRLNDLPTCEIPVERSDRWDDATQWERAPLRVYHDGVRQPIEEVEDVRQEPGRSVLVGVGGVELRQRVTTDVIERDAHLEAQDLVSTNTSYLANVDDPAASTSADVLQQSVDTQSEWEGALASPSASGDLYEIATGKLRPRQVGYFVEAENADTQLTINQTIIDTQSSKWSNDRILEIDEASRNNQAATVAHTFALDHDIASSDVGVAYRLQLPGDGHHGFDISVAGTVVDSVPADALVTGETAPDWFTAGGSAPPNLTAGNVEIRFECTTASAATDPRIFVDACILFDKRSIAIADLSETVTNGVLQGPDLYPVVDVQTADVVTVEQVVGGRLDSTWNKTNGPQAVALSNDSGATWPISASNSQTVEGAFASGSTSLRARFTLAGYDSDSTTSPAGRKAPHEVDLYSLYADLEDVPLLLNRSWDNSLREVLNDIADYGNFIWEVQHAASAGFSVEWTQAGQRTATVDPDLVDYATDTDFSSIHRKAIINGTLVPASTDGVTATHDTWVALGHDWLAETGEEVVDASDGTAYDRGSDYELRPNVGEIQALSTGTIPAGATLDVSYQRHIRGSYESADFDGTYEEFVDTIPAITTQRNANQAALALVRQASDPLVTASVTIDKQPTGMSLVEAVDVDALPVDQPMEVWSLQDSPQQVQLQLGSREQIAETIQRIQSRLAAASRKV